MSKNYRINLELETIISFDDDCEPTDEDIEEMIEQELSLLCIWCSAKVV